MNTNWLLSFPPALILVVLATLARLQHGSWFAPGAFFALIWSILVWLPLLLAPDFYVEPSAVWWILVFVGAVYLGSLLGMAGKDRRVAKVVVSGGANKNIHLLGIEGLIIFSCLLGSWSTLIVLFSVGEGINTFFSVESLMQVSRRLSVARYHEYYEPPFSARLLMVWTYLSASLGGTLFATSPHGNRRWLAFLPMFPTLGIAVLMTTKASSLYAIIFWIGAYFAARIMVTNGRARMLTPTMMSSLGGTLIVLLPLFVLLQMFRYGWAGWELAFEALKRLRVPLFGHLAGFSIWLEHGGWASDTLGLGAFSLAGPFNLLGLSVREMGLYQDFVDISPQYSTNIFTIFRGLIEDYSIVGALLLLFVLGAVSSVAFVRVSHGRLLFLPILSFFYALTLWSHIASVLNYNSLILALMLFTICSVWFENRIKSF